MVVNQDIRQFLDLASKQKEISRALHEKKTEKVVLFIDLSGSTEIKGMLRDEEWLVYIYNFILLVDAICKKSNGEIVKQIGDELLITFPNASDCEKFVDAVVLDTALSEKYEFKISIDFGEVYLIDFDRVKSDPYGNTVDRAARIAKLCKVGTVLCSGSYASKVGRGIYTFVAEVALKGITEVCKVFWRPLRKLPNKNKYLAELLKALNDHSLVSSGYKYQPRSFELDDFERKNRTHGIPFLTSYLLNLPKCPFTVREILERRKNDDEGSVFNYVGYLVDIKGTLKSYSAKKGIHSETYIQAFLYGADDENQKWPAIVQFHPNFDEVIRELKGQTVEVRGVVMHVDSHWISVDYAEFC